MVQDQRQKRAAAGFRYVIMHHLTEEGGTPQEWDAILRRSSERDFVRNCLFPRTTY